MTLRVTRCPQPSLLPCFLLPSQFLLPPLTLSQLQPSQSLERPRSTGDPLEPGAKLCGAGTCHRTVVRHYTRATDERHRRTPHGGEWFCFVPCATRLPPALHPSRFLFAWLFESHATRGDGEGWVGPRIHGHVFLALGCILCPSFPPSSLAPHPCHLAWSSLIQHVPYIRLAPLSSRLPANPPLS